MALSFASANIQYLHNSTTPITAAPFTIAAWIHPVSQEETRTVFSIAHSSNDAEYFRLVYDETSGVIDCETRGSGTLVQATQSGVTEAAWNHVAGVYASAASRTAYVNGTAGSTETTSVTPAGLNRFAIGVLHRPSTVHPFNGRIAEVGLWNVALTSDEINALSKGVSPLRIRTGNLVGYWPLHTTASPAVDILGGFHLTLNGSPTQADHAPVQQLIIPRLWAPPSAGGAASNISPTGIASSEAFGTTTVAFRTAISPTGITSSEAFGTTTVTFNATISPTGITSSETFGTTIFSTNPVIAPTGIASTEAFGSATITFRTAILTFGIASDEAFGNALFTSDLVIPPSGVFSTLVFKPADVSPVFRPTVFIPG